MFERFFDEGLAQSSYLIACTRTREAVVVDPRRDVDEIVGSARRHGLTITHAIETHIHADFVSGARELAATGASVVVGPGSKVEFKAREAPHLERLSVGDVALEILHTPGHTPEHVSVLVTQPDAPVRVLTGDTLFVGAVGRPDLLGEDQARGLGGQLYDSLFGTLLALGDDVEVHPGHGAGSLCGAGIGKSPHSTIGQERRFNPLLQEKSKAAFVAAVLADLPETPPYFPRMKQINRAGPRVLGLAEGVPDLPALTADDAASLVDDGAIVIDLRSPEAFGAGHPAGAINIGFGPRIGYWAGWVVPQASKLVILASDARQAAEAGRQLLRVGFDPLQDVVGYIEGGYGAWRHAGERTARLEVITARDLHERLARREPLTVVDVRTIREWRDGHVEQAMSLPVGELPGRAEELRETGVVATICETGYRSSLAASLLLRAGVAVVNVADGTAAYRTLADKI